MRKVYQKIIDPEKGDCLRAVICSLLGISDRKVPNFVTVKNWTDCMRRFLGSKGVFL